VKKTSEGERNVVEKERNKFAGRRRRKQREKGGEQIAGKESGRRRNKITPKCRRKE